MEGHPHVADRRILKPTILLSRGSAFVLPGGVAHRLVSKNGQEGGVSAFESFARIRFSPRH
jgi:hypothetical protein